MLRVRFAGGHFYDAERRAVLFAAFHGQSVIPCAITTNALMTELGAEQQHALAGFVRQRHHIERLAAALILEGRFETDGSILICSPDCKWLHDASHHPIRSHEATRA